MGRRCLYRLGYPAVRRWRGQDSNLHWDDEPFKLSLSFSLHSAGEYSRGREAQANR